MKKFSTKKGPFLRSNYNTDSMMYDVLICLIPFIIFATYKNGILPAIKGYGSLYSVFKPLIYTSLAALTSLLVEYLYYLIKKDKKSINYLFSESYAIIPGVFLSLIISLNTPIWLVILGSAVASISKMIFGGLGKNKLNPALVGALLVTIILSSYTGGYLNQYEVDTISGATPLANTTASSYVMTYDNIVKPYGSLLNFFFGNIPGAIGETSSLLCIIAFIYLVYKKCIKWKIPVTYILTVAVLSLVICLTKEIELWFIPFNILSGGLLFGAVFMATDPVTSPITGKGQVAGGIFLGVLTMMIRYLTPLPEGVLISILIFNILTILINYLDIKLYTKKTLQTILILLLLVVLSILSSLIISKNITNKPLDDTFQIISKTKDNNKTVYEVMGRGYAGKNSLKLRITFDKDNITNIELLKSNETYTNVIHENNYLDTLKESSNNLDSVDTISGCTYTSKFLKEIVRKTKEDYEK